MTQELLGWLEPAFNWLQMNWADEPWESVKPQFLQQVGLNENDVDNHPDLGVLKQYLHEVDNLGDDDARREVLLNENQRYSAFERIVAATPVAETGESGESEAEERPPLDLNDFYLQALQAIEAEDPELAAQIRNDPDLQAQIYADAQAELNGVQQ